MDMDKEVLLCTAARLYSLGIEVEAARNRLRVLIIKGTSPKSKKVRNAMREFKELDMQWKILEAQYIEERNKMLSE